MIGSARGSAPHPSTYWVMLMHHHTGSDAGTQPPSSLYGEFEHRTQSRETVGRRDQICFQTWSGTAFPRMLQPLSRPLRGPEEASVLGENSW